MTASIPANAGTQLNVNPGQAVVRAVVPRTIAVYGLGYIGLPTSLAFAHAGHRVAGVDVNESTVAALNEGRVHIYEEGLDEYYREARETGRFSASLEPTPAEVHLIAVPTPVGADRRADLSFVEAASRTIGTVLKKGDLVVLESTVPPRTCLDVVAPAIQAVCGLVHGTDYDLAHCPERVIPGRILIELFKNDRIVGGTSPEAAARAAELYRDFVTGEIFETDTTTAEAVKLMENTFRDVNIALANELKSICLAIGADPADAIRLANRHPRVKIHQPGIGVGGHCIPVDPWFLAQAAPDLARLIVTARGVNDARPLEVAADLLRRTAERQASTLCLLGLAYKPDVDDFRESPAVQIVATLAKAHPGPILVVEPYADVLPEELSGYSNVRLVPLEEALAKADLVAGLVAHRRFMESDVAALRTAGGALDYAGLWP